MEKYVDIFEDLKDKIPEYSSIWTNREEDDIGIVILKILAAHMFNLSIYKDRYTRNMYLPAQSVRFEQYINEMNNKRNYTRKSPIISSMFAWFSCGPENSAFIPKYTRVSVDSDGQLHQFLTLRDQIFQYNTRKVKMELIQGDLIEVVLEASQLSFDKIFLSYEDVDFESVEFFVDGLPWKKVKKVELDSVYNMRFSVKLSEEGAYIQLPKDFRKYIASDISEVVLRAVRIGDEFNYNTYDCLKMKLLDPIFDSVGNDVKDKFTLYPVDQEDLTSVYLLDSDSEAERAVTLIDYEELAKTYPGINDCRAYDWSNSDKYINIQRPFKVKMYTSSEYGPTDKYSLLGLKHYLESIGSDRIDLEVNPAEVNTLDIVVLVDVGEGEAEEDYPVITQSVIRRISETFDFASQSIGKMVGYKGIEYEVAREHEDILYIEVNLYPRSPISEKQIFRAGNINIYYNVNYQMSLDEGQSLEKLTLGMAYVDSGGTVTETSEISSVLSDYANYIESVKGREFINKDTGEAVEEFVGSGQENTDGGSSVETSSIIVLKSGVDSGSSSESFSTEGSNTLTDSGSSSENSEIT